MAQTLGLIYCIWRGQKIPVEPKASNVEAGWLTQKGVVTGQQIDYANEMEMGKVTITTKVQRGQSVLQYFTAGQGELQVQCDTGQTWTWPDAFVSNKPNFAEGAGGKQKIEWTVGIPTEVLNG